MNEELISALARLIAGLHVPISIDLPLGTARPAYTEVRDLIYDFGWSTEEEIADRLRKALEYTYSGLHDDCEIDIPHMHPGQ